MIVTTTSISKDPKDTARDDTVVQNSVSGVINNMAMVRTSATVREG